MRLLRTFLFYIFNSIIYLSIHGQVTHKTLNWRSYKDTLNQQFLSNSQMWATL